MPYPYDQIFAGDPASPEKVASNGVVTIFAPADANRTPLTITTLDGLPLPNPIQVNDAGFGPAFLHATLDQVAWAGGGFSGLFVSYQGMKEVAVAAQLAAEEAAAAAQAPTDDMVDRGIQRADIPGLITDAIAAAGGGGGGASISPDPANPGLYLVTAGGQLTADPANAGLYLIGA